MAYSARARFEAKLKLLDYLRKHRDATPSDVERAGHGEALKNDYNGDVDKARNICSRAFYYAKCQSLISSALDYVRNHPESICEDLEEAGFGYVVRRVYDGNMNDLRKDAGVPKPKHKPTNYYTPEEWEQKRQEMLASVRVRGSISRSQIRSSQYGTFVHFHYTMDKLREDAGISEKELWKHRKMALHAYLSTHKDADEKELRERGHDAALVKYYRGSVIYALSKIGMRHAVLPNRKELQDFVRGVFSDFSGSNLDGMMREIEDNNWSMPLMLEEYPEETERITYVASSLTEREQNTFLDYFGLLVRDGFVRFRRPKSLKDVGAKLGVTERRASQILDAAMERMYHLYYEASNLGLEYAGNLQVENLDLPIRCKTLLRNMEIKTLEELSEALETRRREMLRQRNFGLKSLIFLERKLEQFGLYKLTVSENDA